MYRWIVYPTAALAAAVLCTAGHLLATNTAGTNPPSTPLSADPPYQMRGVGSCASNACHGGTGPRGTKGSEYTTWNAVDPHVKAYEALFKPESERMHQKLAVGY